MHCISCFRWEAIPEDHFFIPKTQVETEEYGDGSENQTWDKPE
jgi:hypothetical protein